MLTGSGPDGEVRTIYGKPVLGFVTQKYTNGVLFDDVLANYETAYMNKSTRNIDIAIPGK